MSLIRLLKNLSSNEKDRELGVETSKLLRYTFSKKDTEALPKSVVDMALASSKGANLVRQKKFRIKCIEGLQPDELQALGFDNYDLAAEFYGKNFSQFVKDFQIEDQYIHDAPKDNRTNYEFLNPVYGECNGTKAFPHYYQLNLKNQLIEHFQTFQSFDVLVSMPTGAGKTVLAMEFIVDFFRSSGFLKKQNLNIGWVVDRQTLCEQSLKSFKELWKQKGDRKVVMGRYFSDFNKLDTHNSSSITFATFDLLTSRLKNSEVQDFLQSLDLLVIDEAHSSNATTYRQVLNEYRLLNQHRRCLGLTATPYRTDDGELNSIRSLFQDYYQLKNSNGEDVVSPIAHLVNEQYLSRIETKVLNAEMGSSKSEYYSTLHEAVRNECKAIIERNENTIIFAQSMSHAIALNIYLKQEGVENELIIGDTPSVLRQEYLQKFGDKDHSLSVLVNHLILSTGIDVPGMNSIMVLTEIGSPTLALQILGRAMRGPNNGGNLRNTIYLTKDNFNRLKSYDHFEAIVLNK